LQKKTKIKIKIKIKIKKVPLSPVGWRIRGFWDEQFFGL